MKRVINGIEKAVESFNALLLVVLALTLFTAVVARYVFAFPIPETDILRKFAISWLVFLGSAVALKEKQHLEIDIFTEYLSKRVARAKEVIVYILVLLAVVMLIFVGIEAFMAGLNRRELVPIRFLSSQIPTIYYYSAILVGAAAMLFFHLINFKEFIRKPNAKKELGK